MSARPVVSYDDITSPYHAPPRPTQSRPPPSKKRKWANQKQPPKQQQQQQQQHWGNPTPMTYDDPSSTYPDNDDEEPDPAEDAESRELTYEEIWDDSALIDAWNAASEEYAAYNGPDKGWKHEPVHRSPLWYNVPPKPAKNTSKGKPAAAAAAARPIASVPSASPDTSVNDEGDAVEDSEPLNFETFVPMHDPSLDLPALPQEGDASYSLPDPPGDTVSRDEAFSRASAAMYWAGYWTAVYHHTSRASKRPAPTDEEDDEAGEPEADEDTKEEETEEYVSTQR